jgi:hypothetical protein
MGKKSKIMNSPKYARKYANHPIAKAKAAALPVEPVKEAPKPEPKAADPIKEAPKPVKEVVVEKPAPAPVEAPAKKAAVKRNKKSKNTEG